MSADVIRLRKARKPRAPDITDLLPFVKVVQKGRRRDLDHWAVRPTGDMVEDTKIGTDHGVAFLDYLIKPNGAGMIIHHIAAAQERMMKRRRGVRAGHGWTLVSSFWIPLLEAARVPSPLNAYQIRPMVRMYAAKIGALIEEMEAAETARKRRRK